MPGNFSCLQSWAVCQRASSREISKQSCRPCMPPGILQPAQGHPLHKSYSVHVFTAFHVAFLWKQKALEGVAGASGLASSPRTNTSGSRDISSSIAELRASRIVISCKPQLYSDHLTTLHAHAHSKGATHGYPVNKTTVQHSYSTVLPCPNRVPTCASLAKALTYLWEQACTCIQAILTCQETSTTNYQCPQQLFSLVPPASP